MERRFPLVEIDVAAADRLTASLGAGRVRSMELLAGGHINTNYALVMESGERVVLRIYAHGEAAYETEVEVLRALSSSVPAPRILLARSSPARFPYPHAVLEWIDGTPLD